MQIVAEGDSHVGLFESVLVRRHAGSERDILEFPVAVALVEIVRLAVVGDKQIELSVIVEIRPDRGQAIAALRIVHSSLLRYIGKRSVPVVVVEIVGRSLQPARAALHIESQILAGFARTEYRQIVQMKIHIVRYKKIDPAIAVIISKGCSRRPPGIAAQVRWPWSHR